MKDFNGIQHQDRLAETRIPPGSGVHRNVDFATLQSFQLLIAGKVMKTNPVFRVIETVFLPDLEQHSTATDLTDSDRLRTILRSGEESVGGRNDLLYIGQQLIAGTGQADTGVVTFEELYLQTFLDATNVATYHLLRDSEVFRSFTEVPRFSYLNQRS